MFSHAPDGYECPLCRVGGGATTDFDGPEHAVHRDEVAFVQVSAHRWGSSPGHVVIIPRDHHENLYDLPDAIGAHIFRLVKWMALLLKSELGCDGVSTRQHNEPGGNQDVWHYHHHVFPRYEGDGLYSAPKLRMPDEERAVFAARLRAAARHAPPPAAGPERDGGGGS